MPRILHLIKNKFSFEGSLHNSTYKKQHRNFAVSKQDLKEKNETLEWCHKWSGNCLACAERDQDSIHWRWYGPPSQKRFLSAYRGVSLTIIGSLCVAKKLKGLIKRYKPIGKLKFYRKMKQNHVKINSPNVSRLNEHI